MRALVVISVLLPTLALSQIQINTNFEVLGNLPMETRDTLTTLADTASVTWTFPGLVSYALDVDQYWYYNGSYWTVLGGAGGPAAGTLYTLSDSIPEGRVATIGSETSGAAIDFILGNGNMGGAITENNPFALFMIDDPNDPNCFWCASQWIMSEPSSQAITEVSNSPGSFWVRSKSSVTNQTLLTVGSSEASFAFQAFGGGGQNGTFRLRSSGIDYTFYDGTNTSSGVASGSIQLFQQQYADGFRTHTIDQDGFSWEVERSGLDSSYMDLLAETFTVNVDSVIILNLTENNNWGSRVMVSDTSGLLYYSHIDSMATNLYISNGTITTNRVVQGAAQSLNFRNLGDTYIQGNRVYITSDGGFLSGTAGLSIDDNWGLFLGIVTPANDSTLFNQFNTQVGINIGNNPDGNLTITNNSGNDAGDIDTQILLDPEGAIALILEDTLSVELGDRTIAVGPNERGLRIGSSFYEYLKVDLANPGSDAIRFYGGFSGTKGYLWDDDTPPSDGNSYVHTWTNNVPGFTVSSALGTWLVPELTAGNNVIATATGTPTLSLQDLGNVSIESNGSFYITRQHNGSGLPLWIDNNDTTAQTLIESFALMELDADTGIVIKSPVGFVRIEAQDSIVFSHDNGLVFFGRDGFNIQKMHLNLDSILIGVGGLQVDVNNQELIVENADSIVLRTFFQPDYNYVSVDGSNTFISAGNNGTTGSRIQLQSSGGADWDASGTIQLDATGATSDIHLYPEDRLALGLFTTDEIYVAARYFLPVAFPTGVAGDTSVLIWPGDTPGIGVFVDKETFFPSGGSGNVSNTGTPVNDQIAIWTDATTIEGQSTLTFTATQFTAGNYVFNKDQTVGVSEDNYILTYDNASGEISLEAAAGGGNVSNTGTPVDNQLAVWTSATVVEGDPNLTWDGNTMVFGTGKAIGTSTGAGNTLLLQAYDVDGVAYTTFATLTANNTPTMDLSTAVTIGGNTIAYSGGAFHDGFSDFVANEHVDHSTVTLTAGTGLAGGGDITTNRSFDFDFSELTSTATLVGADEIIVQDGTVESRITLTNFEGQLNHNNLNGFVGNEHVDHSTVTLTAGLGLAGGGDITTNRTFDTDLSEFTLVTTIDVAAEDHVVLFDDNGAGGDTHERITFANFEGQITHNNLAGVVANEHVDHSTVNITGGVGLTAGGDITTSRTLDFDFSELTSTATLTGTDEIIVQDGAVESRITLTNFETQLTITEGQVSDLSHFTPTTIDTDYGNETVTSDWIFQGAGSTGLFGSYDLTIGNSVDYGSIRIGNSGIYRTNSTVGSMDFGGAVVIRQEGNLDVGNDPGIEFAIMEGGNTARMMIPESAAGNATAMLRSVTIAGPYNQTNGNQQVTGDYWTTNDSNLDFDTGTTGSDLFVQDDTEIGGTLFVDIINEEIAASGVTIDGALLKDGDIILTTGNALATSTGAGNTLLLQAYDVDGTAYTTFATLTANNTPTFDLAAAVTIGGNAIAYGGGAFHDGFSDFVANEHVDHSTVTLTAGTGLAGGGDITTNRSFDFDFSELTSTATLVGTDEIIVQDGTVESRITLTNFEGQLTHDNLNGFVADEHVDHSTVTLTAGLGLSGGGDITTNRTFDTDLSEFTLVTTIDVAAEDHIVLFDDNGAGGDTHERITFANFEGQINHNNLAGFVANEHIDATTGDWTGTFDGQEGTYYTDIVNDATPQLGASLDAQSNDITNLDALVGDAASAIQTATGAGNTLLLQAYDTDAPGYVTFATLTANIVPTFDLAASVTIGGNVIADVTGTPVNDQLAVWTDANTLEGSSALTFTATQFTAGNYVFNRDQTVGAGQDNFVLTYDDGTGEILLEAAAGGGNVSNTGTPLNDQIAVWTNATTIEGTTSFTFTATQFKAGNYVFNHDQTVGAGQDNYVLTYDNGSGEILLEAAAGGGNVSNTGTPVNNQLAVWTNATTIEGDPNLTWDATNLVFGTGSRIGTGTTATNTLLLAAYDVDGTSYTTFATLTANNTPTMDLTTAVTVGGNAIAYSGGAFHDGFSDFVGNEHVDHSGVTLTAGIGLSGGGDITANRSFDFDFSELTSTSTLIGADEIIVQDGTVESRITLTNFEGQLTHDNLGGVVANEHVDHSGVTLTAGLGLSGGGDITTNRTFDTDLSEFTLVTTIDVAAEDHVVLFDDNGAGGDTHERITFANFEGQLNHNNLAGYVANEHVDATTGDWTGTFDGQEGTFYQNTSVSRNSAADVGARRTLNFIEGSNVTLTVTDDPGGDEVDITIASSGGGTPGGADTQIQYNDGGAFGGVAPLTYNDATALITYSPTVDEATGDEIALNVTPTINKATSGNYTALNIAVTETAAPGTNDKLISASVGGTELLMVDNAGQLNLAGATNQIVLDFDAANTGTISTTTLTTSRVWTFPDEGGTIVISGGAYHDGFSDFVTNEHIDHSTVDITGGVGLTAGGDITTSRTLDFDFSELTSTATLVGTDEIIVQDGTVESRITVTNFEGQINHDNLNGYVADEHVDATTGNWSGTFDGQEGTFYQNTDVSKNSGASVGARRTMNFIEGANITLTIADDVGGDEVDITIASSGGGAPTNAQYVLMALDGTLSDERILTAGLGIVLTDGGANGNATLDHDLSEYTTVTTIDVAAEDHVVLFDDNGAGADTHEKITFANFEGQLNHNNLAGYVANEHIDATTGDWTGTFDGQEGTYYVDIINDATPQLGAALDAQSNNITAFNNLVSDAAGAIQTATGAGNTLLLQAYDTDAPGYVTFATLTANTTPTFDLSASTTIGGATIVDATGTPANDQIAIWTDANTVEGQSGLTFTATQFTAGNYVFGHDQTVGVGQDNFVLTYDNGTGEITLEAATGGGTPAGADTQIQYNDGGAFGGVAPLTYNDATALVSYSPTVDEATGNEFALNISPTINKVTSGNYTALNIAVTETAAPGTADRLISMNVGGSELAYVDNLGNINVNPSDAATGDGTRVMFGANDFFELGTASTIHGYVNGAIRLEINTTGLQPSDLTGAALMRSVNGLGNPTFTWSGDINTGLSHGTSDDNIMAANANGKIAQIWRDAGATTNIELLGNNNSFGATIAGQGVVRINDVTTTPTGTLTSGGLIYVTGTQLHFLADDGTDTDLTAGGADLNGVYTGSGSLSGATTITTGANTFETSGSGSINWVTSGNSKFGDNSGMAVEVTPGSSLMTVGDEDNIAGGIYIQLDATDIRFLDGVATDYIFAGDAMTAVNYKFNIDQTVGAGQDNFVLTYDDASGEILLESAVGGGNVSNTGTPVNDQIAVWTNATTIEGTTSLTFTATQFKAGNFVFGHDQTVGAGQDNYVLTYDNGTGEITLEAAGGGAHASTHITGQSDEVDGDKLDIDWNPTNYTPTTSPTEADNVDNLTAHLAGVDAELETLEPDGASSVAVVGAGTTTLDCGSEKFKFFKLDWTGDSSTTIAFSNAVDGGMYTILNTAADDTDTMTWPATAKDEYNAALGTDFLTVGRLITFIYDGTTFWTYKF